MFLSTLMRVLAFVSRRTHSIFISFFSCAHFSVSIWPYFGHIFLLRLLFIYFIYIAIHLGWLLRQFQRFGNGFSQFFFFLLRHFCSTARYLAVFLFFPLSSSCALCFATSIVATFFLLSATRNERPSNKSNCTCSVNVHTASPSHTNTMYIVHVIKKNKALSAFFFFLVNERNFFRSILERCSPKNFHILSRSLIFF